MILKNKSRIIIQLNKYFPQYKGWIFWKYFYVGLVGSELFYDTEEEAKIFLKNQINKNEF